MEAISRGRQPTPATKSNNGNRNMCVQVDDGDKVGSVAVFCQTCNDFLCATCISQHKMLRGYKDHTLMESDRTVTKHPAASDVEKCTIHPGNPIQAYCADDNIFVCLECLAVGHIFCKSVGLLSDLSHGVESSREFTDVQKAGERCKASTDSYKQSIQKCRSMNKDWHNKTVEYFKQYRLEILSLVEDIGKTLYEQADKLKDDNEKQLTVFEDKIAIYSQQFNQFFVKIEEKTCRRQNEQLFMALKKNWTNVMDSVQRIESLHQNFVIKEFKLSSDPKLKEKINKTIRIISKETPFPSVTYADPSKDSAVSDKVPTPTPPTVSCKSSSKVNIRSPEDSSECGISGILELSPTELILSDVQNNCLKLVDTTGYCIITKRTLTSKPWNIAKFNSNRLAVSLPETREIQIFTADRKVDACGSIKIPGVCFGIHCTRDHIVASVMGRRAAKILILDFTGKVLKSIQHDAARHVLFDSPWYITSNEDNGFIFASDYNKDTVTCMDTMGAVQWVYQDQELKGPEGITTGNDGCLYVCSRNTNTIHVLSSDGNRIAVIPQRHSRVKCPLAVCFSRYNRTLYVSSDSLLPANYNFITTLNLQ